MMQNMLAMHMANDLVNCPVSIGLFVVAGVALVWSVSQIRKSFDGSRYRLLATATAFVFAGQMINFTLPAMPGTSGHLGGGVLLAILFGPAAGILGMSVLLAVQCLIFNDGGLMALGANIVNMAVVPCFVGGWLYRMLRGKSVTPGIMRQTLAATVAAAIGVTAGAVLVPAQSALSGVLRISIVEFVMVMAGVHLLIGLIEGLITAGVVAIVRYARPSMLGLSGFAQRLTAAKMAVATVVAALVVAGLLSWFASPHADGLEWSYMERPYGDVSETIVNDSAVIAAADNWQGRWGLLPDYSLRTSPLGTLAGQNAEEAAGVWPGVDWSLSLAGLSGTLLTLFAMLGIAVVVRRPHPVAA